jgi:hypothetical protein
MEVPLPRMVICMMLQDTGEARCERLLLGVEKKR